MEKWSDKYVNKLTQGDSLTQYLANRLVRQARVNLLTSTNVDGSPMTTNKKTGRPLIDTGAMLGSIARVDSSVVVNVPYAAQVQRDTGNYFITKPPVTLLGQWLADFLSDK
jgi:hypothetical protein